MKKRTGTRPNVEELLKPLEGLQRKTVEYVFERTEGTQCTRNLDAIGLRNRVKFIRSIRLPACRRVMRKMQSVLPTPELRASEAVKPAESEAAE